ncbi:MAG: hypothetical protein NTX36_09005 [Proteobacteria bacterium]|nr:hypothetical protein [Pseudomonadota bacterium]
MAKEKMVCPISKTMCVECSIYRGRHYYLCFSKGYHGSLLESGLVDNLKMKPEEATDVKFGIPDNMLTSSKCIKNIEDIVMNMDMQVPTV